MMTTKRFPATRHDGTSFRESAYPGDAQRAAKAGDPFRHVGAVLYKKGDWAWLKQVLNLASWSCVGGCCWLCRATFANFTDASLGAEWRASMISNAEYVREQLGEYRSALWNLLGFVLSLIALDPMHIADLGI